jgi:hypothetical protein
MENFTANQAYLMFQFGRFSASVFGRFDGATSEAHINTTFDNEQYAMDFFKSFGVEKVKKITKVEVEKEEEVILV